MDRLKVHEEFFTFGLFIDEICILLLAAPFFVIVKRTKLIATPFLLLAGLLYAICCLTHSKGKFNNQRSCNITQVFLRQTRVYRCVLVGEHIHILFPPLLIATLARGISNESQSNDGGTCHISGDGNCKVDANFLHKIPEGIVHHHIVEVFETRRKRKLPSAF